MTAFRLAWREIGHRPGHAALFALSFALGGAATGALGGYAAAVEKAVRAQAKELWAADLTVKGSAPLLNRLEVWALDRWPGAVSARGVQTYSMARAEKSGEVAQVALAAVTPGYPLYGSVFADGDKPLRDVLAPGRVVVGDKIFSQLGVRPGDALWLGRKRFVIAGALSRRTDAPIGFFELAPALFLTPEDLNATELLSPGSRVFNTLYLNLPPEVDLEGGLRDLKSAAAEETAEVASWKTDNPGAARFLLRTLRFLQFLGFLLLLLGGVGVATALSAAIQAARQGLGVMRAMGASRGLLLRMWAVWAGFLSAAGLAGASFLGIAGVRLAGRIFRDFLPGVEAVFSWPVFFASGGAVLASTGAFIIFPLMDLAEIPPQSVFSREEVLLPARRRFRWLAGFAAVPIFFTAAFIHAGTARGAAVYLGGAALLLVASAGAAWAGRRIVVSASLRAKGATVRLAARGLHRAGAMNLGVGAALSVSAALCLGIYLLALSLREGFSTAAPESGPTAFFINLRPEDEGDFRSLLARPIRLFPLVRGRVTHVDGVPVREIQGRADRRGGGDRLTREFGFSFGEDLPPTDRVVRGPGLWDPDISGPQVSVFDEYRKKFGLRLGSRVTVNILGRRVTAVVASFRGIDQSLRQPFYYFYFKTGSLGDVPYTLMGGLPLGGAEITSLEKVLSRLMPHVTVLDLSEVAALTGRVLNRLIQAVSALGGLGIASGLLLLGTSLAVTLLDRVRESVLYRTLGATKGRVAAIYALEFLWIGSGAFFSGGAVGIAAAWVLTVWGLEMPFRIPFRDFFPLLAGSTLLVVLLSLLVTRRAWRAAPMEALRYE